MCKRYQASPSLLFDIVVRGENTMQSMIQVKTLHYTEKQGFVYPRLSKKIQTHTLKPAKVKHSFRKVSLPPANLCILYPTHL